MKSIYLLLSIQLLYAGCVSKPTIEIRDDFNKYYEQSGLEGAFVLYDEQKEKYLYCNKDIAEQAYTPASTFKICNSLIALETGAISDENQVIAWDGVSRNPVWDKDHNMKSAFVNSTVWFYQELARRIGEENMKYWMDLSKYGNGDISGGIDQFWLTGGLKITPIEQIEFLRRFQNNELGFSDRNRDIVKNIMIVDDSLNYILRAKTGWGVQSEEDIGWYVGYIEVEGNIYYFANIIIQQSNALNDLDNAISFDKSRQNITYQILKDLQIIQ
jgi:beta-lactamase class D